MRVWGILIAVVATACAAAPQAPDVATPAARPASGDPAIQQAFNDILAAEGVEGTLIVRRASDGVEWYANPRRLSVGYQPASTFKILNSLIILQEGVVADPDDDVLAWDGVERSPGWDADASLRTAFQRSMVWAYQEWARRVGHEAMARWVEAADYGDGDIGPADGVDRFWLEGPLTITAYEQIEFLDALRRGDTPFGDVVEAAVRDVMTAESDAGWTLRRKTGWAIRDEPNIGWCVGWLEADIGGAHDALLFAVNIDLPYPDGDAGARCRIARAALIAAGADIPAGPTEAGR